ncbi:MAG: NADH-quinone oxidoreductase subunit A [Alphaproteobacteria bacterium]|nr:NADH-quinone oxidoreductase subunit A [Alphaproteobacteria bacterium]
MNNMTLFPSLVYILSIVFFLITVICCLQCISKKIITTEKSMDLSNYAGGFEPLAKSQSFYSKKFFLYLIVYLITVTLLVALLPWVLHVHKYGMLGWISVFFEFCTYFIGIYFVFKKGSMVS